MKKRPYGELLLRDEWRAKRREILRRDDYACRWCWYHADQFLSAKKLDVHHLEYKDNWPMPWDYPNDWLITLCGPCHMLITWFNKQTEPLFQTFASLFVQYFLQSNDDLREERADDDDPSRLRFIGSCRFGYKEAYRHLDLIDKFSDTQTKLIAFIRQNYLSGSDDSLYFRCKRGEFNWLLYTIIAAWTWRGIASHSGEIDDERTAIHLKFKPMPPWTKEREEEFMGKLREASWWAEMHEEYDFFTPAKEREPETYYMNE